MLGIDFKNTWGNFEDSFQREASHFAVDKQLLSYLQTFVNKTAFRIIDIGCGKGTLTSKILKSFPDAKIHGIDQFFPFNGQKGINSISYRQGNIEEGLPYEDDYFQACISKFVTMYLRDLGFHFTEVARVLENQQEYFLITYNPEYPLEKQRQYFGRNVEYGDEVENQITGSGIKVELLLHAAEDYDNAIKEAGFRIISELGFMHPEPKFEFAKDNPFVKLLRLKKEH